MRRESWGRSRLWDLLLQRPDPPVEPRAVCGENCGTPPHPTGRPSPLGPRALSPGPTTNYKPPPPPSPFHGSLQTAGETAAPHAESSRGGPTPPRPRAPLRCRAPGYSSTTNAAEAYGLYWKGKVCLTWRHVLPFFPSLKQQKGSGLSRRETFEIKQKPKFRGGRNRKRKEKKKSRLKNNNNKVKEFFKRCRRVFVLLLLLFTLPYYPDAIKAAL